MFTYLRDSNHAPPAIRAVRLEGHRSFRDRRVETIDLGHNKLIDVHMRQTTLVDQIMIRCFLFVRELIQNSN
jgi:hypothetical protein